MTRSARPIAAAMIFFVLAGCRPAPTTPAGPSPQQLPTVSMEIGAKVFTLQLANDAHEREIGLMYVPGMPADRGMIFTFPDEDDRGFWMKNTQIPLDVIYVNSAGKIVSWATMKPFNLVSTYSDGPAKYVIELNAGVAARLNLKAGQQLAIPAAAKETGE